MISCISAHSDHHSIKIVDTQNLLSLLTRLWSVIQSYIRIVHPDQQLFRHTKQSVSRLGNRIKPTTKERNIISSINDSESDRA
jgi:hypothetical protein